MQNILGFMVVSFLLGSCGKDPSLPSNVSAKIKKLIFTSISAGVSRVDTFSYQYDSLDRLSMEKSFLQNSIVIYDYINNSRCIQRNYINGIEGLNIVYIANSINKLDSTLVISTDKKDTVYTNWLYSSNTLLTQVKHFNRQKELWKVDYFTYDNNNNVRTIEEKDPNENLLQSRIFEVNSETPYWYNFQHASIPPLFVNTPIKQTTNNNEISTINYIFDESNRIIKETWNTSINNSVTIKEYTYY